MQNKDDFEYFIYFIWSGNLLEGNVSHEDIYLRARALKFNKKRVDKLVNHTNPRYCNIIHDGVQIVKKLKTDNSKKS